MCGARYLDYIANLVCCFPCVRNVFIGVKVLCGREIAESAFLLRAEIVAVIVPCKVQIACAIIDHNLLKQCAVGSKRMRELWKSYEVTLAYDCVCPILYYKISINNAQAKICSGSLITLPTVQKMLRRTAQSRLYSNGRLPAQ